MTLNQYIIGSPLNLILPHDLFSQEGHDTSELLVIRRADYGKLSTLIAERSQDLDLQKDEIQHVATAIVGAPQQHGIIYRQPSNLFELHRFLKNARIDLLSELRKLLPEFKEKGERVLDARLILIAYLPKIRAPHSFIESSDMWAFLLENTVKEIGIRIGLWEAPGGVLGLLIPQDSARKGENIKLGLLNPMFSFSRELASRTSGIAEPEKKEILLVGGGALGSQVFTNLIRMGFGKWTIVDEDCLLPHNLARHALTGEYVGYSKAECLAYLASNTVKGEPVAESIIADILNPNESAEKLRPTYEKADTIIDASTSIAVARHLARDVNSAARRISIFLNPSGSDVVMLAESKDRSITLDCLEMQYYRYLRNKPELRNHLRRNNSSTRYARTCRDISSVIPQDLVALHSAICSRGIRRTSSDLSARIWVWRADADLSVKHYSAPVHDTIAIGLGDWTLCSDQWLLSKINQARKEKLPNETGGVLVGSFDLQRKIVYIVDTILSPPDSIEWPTVYIRGAKGLKEEVCKARKATAGMLDYVGEWHSHTDGYNTKPSEDDKKAFSWLVDIMDVYGLPALMMIAGSQQSWHVGRMEA